MKRFSTRRSDIASLRDSLLTDWPERRQIFDQSSQWITHSEFAELREQLGAALRGFSQILHPVKAFRLRRIHSWASEGRRRRLNDEFLERRYLDPELAGLNAEQRKAVLIQEDRTLVIAGAGTGKTHTMVAKAHDTVRAGISRPSEIAFVTFTNAAAKEIRERCSALDGIEIGTIHELARQIIRRAEGKRPKLSPLAHDKHKLDRLDRIERWLQESIQRDPALLVDVHARRAAAERCRSPATTVPPFVAVPPGRTRVKSWGEAQIALTLHLAGVAYKYEEEFPVPAQFRSEAGARYLPDFFLPDDPDCTEARIAGGIWYEHFAHDRRRQLPTAWSDEDRERYETQRRWKERLHHQLETRFAASEYGDIELCRTRNVSFPELVLQRIADLGCTSAALPTPTDVQALIDALRAQDANARHLHVTYEIDAWIKTYRQQVPGRANEAGGTRDRELMQEASSLSRLAMPVMALYEDHLEQTGTVDHEGTILHALRYVEDGQVRSPWHVLLVDEYQDVNPAQAAFLHALWRSAAQAEELRRPRMTAVGDDWQAIFGFQGGDVELIRGFGDPGSSSTPFDERVALKQTYRFGPDLARSTRHFATRDKSAIERQVVGLASRRPDRKWPNSVVIAAAELTEQGRSLFGWAGDNRTCAVVAALSRIAQQSEQSASESSVLILGRKNTDIGRTGPQAEGGLDRKQVQRACEQQGIAFEFSTVHKAKGREADYVIFVDTGPPKAAESGRNRALERALSLLRYGGPNVGEERRIWYVALTRARHKAYVVSDTGQEPSPLFGELMRNEDGAYDVSDHELADYLESTAPRVPCPKCAENGENSAVLILRAGRNGPFASCTSFVAGEEHYCGHTERACETCGIGLMARDGDGRASCSMPGCGQVVPLCRCSPPKPMAVRRNKTTKEPFWGCQSFGTEDSCKKTKSLNDPTGATSRSALHSVRASCARR